MWTRQPPPCSQQGSGLRGMTEASGPWFNTGACVGSSRSPLAVERRDPLGRVGLALQLKPERTGRRPVRRRQLTSTRSLSARRELRERPSAAALWPPEGWKIGGGRADGFGGIP
jgi:hypothetical protein